MLLFFSAYRDCRGNGRSDGPGRGGGPGRGIERGGRGRGFSDDGFSGGRNGFGGFNEFRPFPGFGFGGFGRGPPLGGGVLGPQARFPVGHQGFGFGGVFGAFKKK